MNTLYSWKIRRAGAGMTITHSCGKIVNVAEIEADGDRIIATTAAGAEFELATPPYLAS